jgi:hypothetical protein
MLTMAGRRTAVTTLLVAVLAVLALVAPTSRFHGSQARAPSDERTCLAWNISGTWDWRSSYGQYGRFEFKQDAQGNLTGSYYNLKGQTYGIFSSGKVTGTSVGFHSTYDEHWEGTVSADGGRMAGIWKAEGWGGSGTWIAWGAAKCTQWQEPPPEGSAFIRTLWGEYVFYTEIPSVPACSGATAPEQAGGDPPQINTPGEPELWFEAWVVGQNLPGTARLVNVRDDGTEQAIGTLTRAGEEGGRTLYRGKITIKGGTLTPDQIQTNRVLLVDPRDPDRRLPVVIVRRFLQDPAGNIYNTATSELIPGATCYLYKKQGGAWVLWPAANFGQENPLVSDSNGHYAWLTDAGDFKVKVSKSGFTDGSGGPVTVPPEVTDLHIGLTPTTVPAPELGDLQLATTSGIQELECLPGQQVQMRVPVSNPTSGDMEVTARWTTTGPEGKVVSEMSGSGTYDLGPFDTELVFDSQVPSAATPGQYTLRLEVEQGSQTRFRGTQFRVERGQSTFLPLVVKGFRAGPADHWATIVEDGFEGIFPGQWQVWDRGPGSGEYFWAKRNCRAFAGDHSVWAVGGGADGSTRPCGSDYPHNVESWMVYGPFSLADATAAELRFQLWLNVHSPDDRVARLASTNGSDFYGTFTTGSTSGWTERVLDLSKVPDRGSLLGQPQVWVALVFDTNDIVALSEGAYVDNLVVRKYVSVAGRAPEPSLTAASETAASRDAGLVEGSLKLQR